MRFMGAQAALDQERHDRLFAMCGIAPCYATFDSKAAMTGYGTGVNKTEPPDAIPAIAASR